MSLTHLSLFSGIGGLDLAAEMAGFVTVGQCEWADYPTKVLEKHWPDVPRWRDIRTLTKESFYERTGLRTVDVISGGFPCQPFSVAGKRGGKDDDRYLWPEMCRVIEEIRPSWVIGENVPGIVNLALDTVLSDLETIGYATQAFIVPACGVDAPHRRYRVCIVAHAENDGDNGRVFRGEQDAEADGRKGTDNGRRAAQLRGGERGKDKPGTAGMADGVRAELYGTDTDTDINGLSGRLSEPLLDTLAERERERDAGVRRSAEKSGSQPVGEDWLPEPELDRMVDWLPDRVDRIKCLGNAVVPQQFYPFFKAIADLEAQCEK